MSIKIRPPWTIAMSPVGPSIEYVNDYRFNRTVNVNDNTSTLGVSGPGELFGVEVKDERAEKIYTQIWNVLEANSFKYIKVGITGSVSVEWEPFEGIEQAMHLTIGGHGFDALWRVNSILYDDADFITEAASTLVESFDPARAAKVIEDLVEEVGTKLHELFEISYEVGKKV